MSKLQRISAREAREKSLSGEAKLVCAYNNEDRCRSILLQGSMHLQEFLNELPGLAYDQEIIFYCA
ncbi:MAG: ArsR family transcriptional regulator [Thermodesulfobacteriota bacterium]